MEEMGGSRPKSLIECGWKKGTEEGFSTFRQGQLGSLKDKHILKYKQKVDF